MLGGWPRIPTGVAVTHVCSQSWEDQSLHDWPEDDHRIFVGDLGDEYRTLFEQYEI